MNNLKRLAALFCLLALALSLSACGKGTPLAAYNDALEKTMAETSYKETVTMSATATLDGVTVGVSIKSDMICSGNIGSEFVASGIGEATVGSGEEKIVTPYRLYVKNRVYYYDYPNYNEDGSSYKYRLIADFGSDDPICDLLPLTVADLDDAQVTNETGKTVIVMTVKQDKMESIMSFVAASMDPMLFGMDTVTLTPYAMTVTTTLDGEGRVEQSTATMTASGTYYGAYMTVVYVYDMIYSDYGTAEAPSIPDDLASYPAIE